MNGVTILSTGTKEMSIGEQFCFVPDFSSFLGLAVIIALVIGCCLLVIYSIKLGDVTSCIGGLLVCILISLVTIDLTFSHQMTKTIPEYKVTIDKNVSLVEFYDKYTVLEQDGLIFTIIDKNWKNKDYNEVLNNNG